MDRLTTVPECFQVGAHERCCSFSLTPEVENEVAHPSVGFLILFLVDSCRTTVWCWRILVGLFFNF